MSDLTPTARKLLADARPGFGPSAAARERMRAEVLRDAATTASAASEAPPSGVRLSLKAHGGKLLGATLVALVAGMYATVRSSGPEPVTVAPTNIVMASPVEEPGEQSREQPAAAAAEELASNPLPEAPAIAAANLKASPNPTAPETSAARKVVTMTKGPVGAERGSARAEDVVGARPAERAMPPGSLGAEMRLLREAQSAFKSGDLALARRKVDDHARSFPDGVLREERLVLGVLLLCAEGQVERARRTADELATAHPRSSHLEALRGSCAGTAGPPGSND